MKFLGRAKQTVENVGKGGNDDAGEGSRMKDAIRYSDKKRKIALQMGIDPYSTNAVLQKELDEVAWASWAVDSASVSLRFRSVARSERHSR